MSPIWDWNAMDDLNQQNCIDQANEYKNGYKMRRAKICSFQRMKKVRYLRTICVQMCDPIDEIEISMLGLPSSFLLSILFKSVFFRGDSRALSAALDFSGLLEASIPEDVDDESPFWGIVSERAANNTAKSSDPSRNIFYERERTD